MTRDARNSAEVTDRCTRAAYGVMQDRGTLADGTEQTLFDALQGQAYLMEVGGRSDPRGGTGALHLTWEVANGAFGDRDAFANALALQGASGATSGSNVNATKQPGEPNHNANDGGASVWFSWTTPVAEHVRCQVSGGTLVLAGVSVYTGVSVDALTRVAGDAWNDPPPANALAATFQATAGTTYRIVVDGLMCEDGPPVCIRPATGSFTLTWSVVP